MTTVTTTAEEFEAFLERGKTNRAALDEAVRDLSMDDRGQVCETLLGYIGGEVDPGLWLAGLRYARALANLPEEVTG